MAQNTKTSPSKEHVWKMFDKISSTYDSINRVLSFGIDKQWRKKMATFLPKGRKLKILDCATGTCDQLIAFLEEKNTIHEATGIDLASKMLEIGKDKLKLKTYQKKVKLVEASGMKIPFDEEVFDAASISFGIRNMDDPLLCLREIHRVLKKKGRILVLEFSLPKNKSIQTLHLFYLRHLLPRIGGMLSKNKKAYSYLNQTIETFPSGDAFCSLLKEAGFSEARAYPMTLGAVTIYIGDKK